jgi:hypothetical protein
MTSRVLSSRVGVEFGGFRWDALRVLGVLGDGRPWWWWMLMMLVGDVVVEAVKVVHESRDGMKVSYILGALWGG